MKELSFFGFPDEHVVNMAAPSAEVQFAQRLAANEKKTRDKALKKLRKYIRSRSATKTGLSESDLIKLWKGLHYCMWMQDKPLLQEELAVHISRLLFSFPTLEGSLLFLHVFLITEAREWNGIDRLRMDKFMMLVRQMLNQTFVLLKQDGWKDESTEKLVTILNLTLLNTTDDNMPDSLSMHLADIFIPELTKVGWEQLDSKTILTFLSVFDNYLQVGKRPSVLKRIFSSVYNSVIEQIAEKARQAAMREAEGEIEEKEDGSIEDEEDSDSGYDEDSEPRLKFDCEMIAEHLFEIGSSDKCCGSNRQKLYTTVKRLRDAASGGAEPADDEGEEYDPDADFDDAVMRLNKLNTVKKQRKRKHKDDDEEEEEADDTEEAESETVEEKKTKKKKKRKLKDDTETQTKEESEVKKKKMNSGGNSMEEENNSNKAVQSESDSPRKKRKKKKKKSKQSPSQDASERNSQQIQSPDVSTEEKGSFSAQPLKVTKGENSANLKVGVKVVESLVKKRQKGQLKGQMVETSLENGSKKKSKKKKQRSEDELEDEKDVSPAKKLKTVSQQKMSSDKVSKQLFQEKKLKMSRNAEDTVKFDEPVEEGEVEIWVPSKKYQNKIKKQKDQEKGKVTTDEKKIKENKNKKSAGNVKFEAEVKTKKKSVSAFAQFEKISTPPAAFVKKAIAKAAKTPAKKSGETALSTPQLTSSEKKVKFNMKKNTAQKFEDSINISPLPAFVPTKSPVQGILKSPLQATSTSGKKSHKKKKDVMITPTAGNQSNKKNQKKLKLTSDGSTPGSGKKALTRARAVDFF